MHLWSANWAKTCPAIAYSTVNIRQTHHKTVYYKRIYFPQGKLCTLCEVHGFLKSSSRGNHGRPSKNRVEENSFLICRPKVTFRCNCKYLLNSNFTSTPQLLGKYLCISLDIFDNSGLYLPFLQLHSKSESRVTNQDSWITTIKHQRCSFSRYFGVQCLARGRIQGLISIFSCVWASKKFYFWC